MNDWTESNPNPADDLETRLRSWTPRGPSAALERRLFARAGRDARREPAAPAWHWVAPALASCVMLMVLANEAPPPRATGVVGEESGLWTGPFPSGQLRRISLEHNLFAAFQTPSLGWTREGESPSTNASFSAWKTNGF